MIPRFGRPVHVLSMRRPTRYSILPMTPMDRESRNRITTSVWVQPVYKLVGAVYAKGAALKNCLGFADGTVRPIARPDESQRVVYNCLFSNCP